MTSRPDTLVRPSLRQRVRVPAGATARHATRNDLRRRLSAGGAYTVLIAAAVATLGPFVLSLGTSLKTPRQLASQSALAVPIPPTLTNYADLFGADHDFRRPILVTLLVAAFTVLTQLTFSVLAAYAFARIRFPGRDAVFWVYIATMMIPAAVTIVPLYLMMVRAGLRDTFWGLALPGCLGSPYAVFLLREYFRGIPQDLEDAARLDGASTLDVLVEVIIPLSRPILATLALITVVSQWNSFLWPLVITGGERWRVLTVATAALQTEHNGNWTLVLAATTVAMLPLVVLFLVFQKQIVRSIAITGFR